MLRRVRAWVGRVRGSELAKPSGEASFREEVKGTQRVHEMR